MNPKFPYGDFFVNYGGESELGFQERISSTLLSIMQQENHDIVLAVAHGGVCDSFMRTWMHTSLVDYKVCIGNCTLFKYEFDDDVFTCVDIIRHDFSSLS